jgi:UPF0042 nucleotide-binding protein
MRLIILSGLSGSGKSVALHVLEDLGYNCIDNMPAALLKSVVDTVTADGRTGSGLLAVGIDARNSVENLETLPKLMDELRAQGIDTELIFLQADDEVLLKRFSETRRRHPLSLHDGSELHAAIARERDLLSVIVNSANLVIDTSRTSVYGLADVLRSRVDRRKTKSLSVLVQSFGFKHGIPSDADFVFDLRCLPNPYWSLELRGLTGRDPEVTRYLDDQPGFVAMYDDILAFLRRWIPEYETANRGYLTVAIGCTGGQHRSVYMVEKVAASLREIHDPVQTRHNELGNLALFDR